MRVRSRPLLALSLALLASAAWMLVPAPATPAAPEALLAHEAGDRVLVDASFRPLLPDEVDRLDGLGLLANQTVALAGDMDVLVAAHLPGPELPSEPWYATVLAVHVDPGVVVLALDEA